MQKRVIEYEYNDMVNLKYFTYLIGEEAEALLDRIEGAIMKKPSTFTIDTQFILTSSSVATRYLPSEPVSSIKRLNRPKFWGCQPLFYQHRRYICTLLQTHQSLLLNILGVKIYLGPADFDNDCENIVTVFTEISDEGTRHP